MTAEPWTLTIRAGSQVEHEQLQTLPDAIAALARRLDELASEQTAAEEVRFLSRRIEPVRQVAARLEIAGPGGRGRTVRGGVDLRGDGSAEAYTGRVRRALVERRADESAPEALARALST
ncbi:MAG: hypothetical protein ABSB73_11985 [Solirubrobacteraceae bacterium]